MAAKTTQMGVRLEDSQIKDLEEIAEKYSHTPTGLIRLAVENLIKGYKTQRQLPVHPFTDKREAAAAAGVGQ